MSANPTAIEDVTERAQAARALEACEVRYRRLFETAEDAILILNGNTGKIIDSNPCPRGVQRSGAEGIRSSASRGGKRRSLGTRCGVGADS